MQKEPPPGWRSLWYWRATTASGPRPGWGPSSGCSRFAVFLVLAGFMVVGLIYMIYLYRRHPGRVTDVGLVHLDALEEDAA